MNVSGGIVINPISRNESRIQIVWVVDPKLKVPSFLINFITRSFSKNVFFQLEQVSQRVPRLPHADRILNNNGFYSFVDDHLERCFSLLSTKAASDSSARQSVDEDGVQVIGRES
eukprot:Filipodium_phascolosomae@DN5836_c0_g1_i1.p3